MPFCELIASKPWSILQLAVRGTNHCHVCDVCVTEWLSESGETHLQSSIYMYLYCSVSMYMYLYVLYVFVKKMKTVSEQINGSQDGRLMKIVMCLRTPVRGPPSSNY